MNERFINSYTYIGIVVKMKKEVECHCCKRKVPFSETVPIRDIGDGTDYRICNRCDERMPLIE